MPYYAYKARDARGQLVAGVLESTDSNSAAEQLFGSGMTPVDIHSTSGPEEENWFGRLFEKKVRSIDVQLFSRQMHTLLRAGVPIMRGLAGLQESATNPAFAKVIADLRAALDSGRELSYAMRQHREVFSAFYLSMVRVGEMTGRLDEVFMILYDHLEFERDMRNRVKTALRYPMFVVIAMLAAITIINLLVVPSFVKVFNSFNAPLPLMTQILIGSSNFMVKYWWLLLLGLVAGVFGWFRLLGTQQGRMSWDRFKLRIPIAGKIMTKATLARFARSFALASKSGVPIVQGLNVVAQTVDNAWLSAKVEGMRDGVERGESILRTATASGVFTPVVLQMVAVGEETGELDDLMEEIADMYGREVDYELKTLSAQLEPILITGLGIMVLILALGIFLPIWDLGRAALHK
ncbi:type II secretion system F family protein [Massilia sp. W12]|uniref:type II secretion system F family protein n=1 Tax=Massilia sp. W12 TaxID=3126507 RepID=UPI0030CF22AF